VYIINNAHRCYTQCDIVTNRLNKMDKQNTTTTAGATGLSGVIANQLSSTILSRAQSKLEILPI
jgi:hypothetical protein